MAQQGEEAWSISPVDFSSYFMYYHRITPPDTSLSGSRAREFFLQTRLPPTILSHIWKLSDIDRDGSLNSAEFAVAMHLVKCALKGITLPDRCPPYLVGVVNATLYSQLPAANQAHLEKCKTAFGAFFENIGIGVLGADAARYLMLKSNLPKPQLYHIWRLSDLDGDGRLSFLEFSVAMHLIFVAKLGYTLPVAVDPHQIMPSSLNRMLKEVQMQAEKFPEVPPSDVPMEPFSPPSTPSDDEAFFEENPFISDAFINLPARQFRERTFEHFVGDPFEVMDPFSAEGSHNISARSEDFVEYQNGHVASNGSVVNGRDSPLLTSQSPRLSQSSQASRESLAHSSKASSRANEIHSSKESVNSQSSYTRSPASQRGGLNSREFIHSQTSGSPASLRGGLNSRESVHSQTSSPASNRGGLRSRETHSTSSSEHISHSEQQQQYHSSHDSLNLAPHQLHRSHDSLRSGSERGSNLSLASNQSGSSSPRLRSGRRSEYGSTASFQEVVVEERVEPVLQLATAVDVVGSREMTPVADRDDTPVGVVATPTTAHTQDSLSAEITNLSKASRKFVIESQSKLEEQQKRSQSYTVLEESRQASIQGPTATSKEVLVSSVSSESSEPALSKNSQMSQEEVDYEGDLDALEVLSQLDDLEAEMMSTLDEDDFDLDELNDEPALYEEDLGEVGGIDFGNELRRMRDDDRKTPVGDEPKTPTGDDHFFTNGGVVESSSEQEEEDELDNGLEEVEVTPTKVANGTAVNGADSVAYENPVRQEQLKRKSQMLEAAMDEIDSLFEDELADINDMFQEFETKDKQTEAKRKEELREIELKLNTQNIVALPDPVVAAESVERKLKKRDDDSRRLEEEWEQEMAELEAKRLRELEREKLIKEVESDEVVVSLDAQLHALIEEEEAAVKIAQKEKELLAARQKAEAEQREKEAKEKMMKGDKQELTIEEWIEWMEEKKKAGMTPQQVAELERRKKAWAENKKIKEEKRKREEEEQIEKTRQKMAAELRAFKQADSEIKSSRLTDEELEMKRKEKALQKQQEAEVRKERTKAAKETRKLQEVEELKPKARSALAARWEERIKARSEGKMTREDNKATVLSGRGMSSLQREEERLTKRMVNGSRLSTSSENGP